MFDFGPSTAFGGSKVLEVDENPEGGGSRILKVMVLESSGWWF